MRTLAVVPAYNEAKNIAGVINDIKKEEPDLDILVIDDGSTDDTVLIAQNSKKSIVITLPHNLGIGGVVQTGFKYAERNNYDLIVRLDGDGQHPAKGIAKILPPVLAGQADLVIGSRFLKDSQTYHDFVRRIGQGIISFFVSIFSGQKITDSTSGFRCYNKKAVVLLNRYYPTDFPEPEEIIFLKKNNFVIKEVAISMLQREEGNSSIGRLKSIYYMIKVVLSLFISVLRTPVIK